MVGRVPQVAEVSGYVKRQRVQSRQQLLKVSVLASAFLLAVVLGNVSLRYIPVSFAQVTLLPGRAANVLPCQSSPAPSPASRLRWQ